MRTREIHDYAKEQLRLDGELAGQLAYVKPRAARDVETECVHGIDII
jgi:hypothetical protein